MTTRFYAIQLPSATAFRFIAGFDAEDERVIITSELAEAKRFRSLRAAMEYSNRYINASYNLPADYSVGQFAEAQVVS